MRHFVGIRGVALAALFLISCEGSMALGEGKQMFGWVEKVHIKEAGFSIQAKLDTGADSSSIHATNVEEFTKDGEKWVRFRVRNHLGESAMIESAVEREALIKSHAGKSHRRYVVRLGLCLGDIFQEEDVNLVNRTKFDYRFLVGRSFLNGNALIDPAVMFLKSPSCKEQESKDAVPQSASTKPASTKSDATPQKKKK